MERFRRDKKRMKCHGKNNSCGHRPSLAYQEHWEQLCPGIFTYRSEEAPVIIIDNYKKICRSLPVIYNWCLCSLRTLVTSKASLSQAESPSLPHGARCGVALRGDMSPGQAGDECGEGETVPAHTVTTSIPSPAWGYPHLCKGQSDVCWRRFWKSSFMVLVSVFSFLLERTA